MLSLEPKNVTVVGKRGTHCTVLTYVNLHFLTNFLVNESLVYIQQTFQFKQHRHQLDIESRGHVVDDQCEYLESALCTT